MAMKLHCAHLQLVSKMRVEPGRIGVFSGVVESVIGGQFYYLQPTVTTV